MPDVGEAEFLIGYWKDIGLALPGGMGLVPLTATEVQAWQRGTGIELQAWEFSALLAMSRGYLVARQEGANPASTPPYGDPINEFDRATVGQKVCNAFKAFIQAQQRP